jgi:signal transduction histidine kinase/DNA-binding response OmpR family regulator/ligand-binding sensor domain-containing protein
MGTYDGLDRYDGTDIRIYKPDSDDPHSLSGNVVRRVVESRDGNLWIMTKGGLNRYSRKTDRVEARFTDFAEDCSMGCDSEGDFYILTRTGYLFHYDRAQGKMVEMEIPDLRPTVDWISLLIDADDVMWITNNGTTRRYAIDRTGDGVPRLERLGNFDHPRRVTHIYYDKGAFVVIDAADDMFVLRGGEKTFVRNLSPILRRWGDISCVVFDGEDIVAGLRTSGVVRLVAARGFAEEKLSVNCGVFSLLKDDVQDILWVATDGQGVWAFMREEYSFGGINLDELPIGTGYPVRAIYSDRHGDLWLGTKGNGIIRIEDYRQAVEYGPHNVRQITAADGLSSGSVFSLVHSRARDVIWIGSGGPAINYYSYADGRVHTLRHDPGHVFPDVYSIYEADDGVLWLSSLFSLYKLDIGERGTGLEVRAVRRFDFNIRDKQIFNKIHAIVPENDSILWLAMRGNGAIRFDNRSGDYRVVTFDDGEFAPMNDILAIHRDGKGGLWFGSSYGVNTLAAAPDGSFSSRNYDTGDGIANNTIHGILESVDGDLWLSSNAGLTVLDTASRRFRNFDVKSGLKVIEFSDNAYYRDENSSRLFFGGIDGVVWIEPGTKKKERFVPPIFFTGLHIINEKASMDDHLVMRRGREVLRLRYNQNFFAVSFSVNDFVEGADKKFSYMLEGFGDVWMNTSSREAHLANIPPGKYVLRVRYSDELGSQSPSASLEIEIRSPWWAGVLARLIYGLAALATIFLSFLHLSRRYERKRRKMADELSRKYKDEMYENKLRFFTNITHEFCTPLTLIHTPGERILGYGGSDDYIKKYARMILSNSERLNTLIQEIIDFRRMETGNKVAKIEPCDIGEICGEIMEAFADTAEENGIDFGLSAQPGMVWNSDRGCIVTILNNLVSNAFKYTERSGTIRIAAGIDSGELTLSVYNSGKGISPEDVSRIFNRYSVLDNVEQNMIKGISSRNGLGLAICKSMVELLGGVIDTESEPGRFARFVVRLPRIELPEAALRVPTDVPQAWTHGGQGKGSVPGVDHAAGHEQVRSAVRPKILIVDDNEEILFTLRDILSDDYTVATAKSGREGYDRLSSGLPDLVVTDVMMPDGDGISMTKQIKLNPHTMHIPVVIISARLSIDDQIEGIASGADAYIKKPFDIQYLKTLVCQLIDKHRKLKEYYNSSASAYDYMDGKLLPNEMRDFIRQVVQTIDSNIDVAEFTPEDIADNMRISLRTLYRRFKEADLPTPKDFIRRQRIEYSAKLLVSTRQTIQEIMYAAGFTTRSHFYKEFMRRYGKSPSEFRAGGIEALDEGAVN